MNVANTEQGKYITDVDAQYNLTWQLCCSEMKSQGKLDSDDNNNVNNDASFPSNYSDGIKGRP